MNKVLQLVLKIDYRALFPPHCLRWNVAFCFSNHNFLIRTVILGAVKITFPMSPGRLVMAALEKFPRAPVFFSPADPHVCTFQSAAKHGANSQIRQFKACCSVCSEYSMKADLWAEMGSVIYRGMWVRNVQNHGGWWWWWWRACKKQANHTDMRWISPFLPSSPGSCNFNENRLQRIFFFPSPHLSFFFPVTREHHGFFIKKNIYIPLHNPTEQITTRSIKRLRPH